jgi:hypothetical protein
MRLVARATLVLVALLGGCYRIDADVTGLATTAGEQQFPAAGAAAGTTIEVARMITFEPTAPLIVQLRAARIDSVTLAPAAGVTSLDFLKSVTLTLQTDTGDIPLVDASGAGGRDHDHEMTGSDGRVRLPVHLDVDPALLGGPLHIAAAMTFVAPPDAWAMRVEAALTVNLGADIKP